MEAGKFALYRETLMRLLKCRFATALVIYFAGFATAVYFLAPQNVQADDSNSAISQSATSGSDDNAAFELGPGLRKCVDMVTVKSDEFGEFIKAKIQDSKDSEQNDSDSK